MNKSMLFYSANGELIKLAITSIEKGQFNKIFRLLEDENIKIVDVGNGCVTVEDLNCGFKLLHAIASWEIFRVVDVADMIISARNNFKTINNI